MHWADRPKAPRPLITERWYLIWSERDAEPNNERPSSQARFNSHADALDAARKLPTILYRCIVRVKYWPGTGIVTEAETLNAWEVFEEVDAITPTSQSSPPHN